MAEMQEPASAAAACMAGRLLGAPSPAEQSSAGNGVGMLGLGRASSSCFGGMGVGSLIYRRSDSSTFGVGWLNQGVGKLSRKACGGGGTGCEAGQATDSCSNGVGTESGTVAWTFLSMGGSQQNGVGWLSGRCWLSGGEGEDECMSTSSGRFGPAPESVIWATPGPEPNTLSRPSFSISHAKTWSRACALAGAGTLPLSVAFVTSFCSW